MATQGDVRPVRVGFAGTAMDLGARVYDHSFHIDPIVRSLLDTDFYKLLMLQMTWRDGKGRIPVTFGLINRTTSVRLADDVDLGELVAQLDHARTLRFTGKELIWLAGNTFYGRAHIFEPDFIEWLRDFSLPEYEVRVEDGQFVLRFAGPWQLTTMWEIPALSIMNELRARHAMKGMGRLELDILYSRAKSRLWGKVERLRPLKAEGPLRIADFGTRRRHGYLWQRWCCEALQAGLGDAYVGTSNVHLAMETNTEAIGTNAHELAMVYCALAGGDPVAMRASRYAVLSDWGRHYDGNMLVFLPDAYGTTAFLRDAPAWLDDWTGARPDSKPPVEGGEELVAWWESRGQDPSAKLIVFSDGMDDDSIESTFRRFNGRVRQSFGWGTNLTNDFKGCAPGTDARLKAISLVCKVVEVDGRPAVKLSDNPTKATGPKAEVARYLEAFGDGGMAERLVTV